MKRSLDVKSSVIKQNDQNKNRIKYKKSIKNTSINENNET
jgi:hypothetical protein